MAVARVKTDIGWQRIKKKYNKQSEDEKYTFFSGYPDYGAVLSPTIFTGSVSIECEVLVDPTTIYTTVMSYGSDESGGGTQSFGWGIQLRASLNTIYADCVKSGTYTTDSIYALVPNMTTQWHKIKAEYNSNGYLKLYCDDILVATGTVLLNATPRNGGSNNIFAKAPSIFSPYATHGFIGSLKNLKYYNGTVLYNHYPMDDLESSTVFRDIINGEDATKYGSPSLEENSNLWKNNVTYVEKSSSVQRVL